MHKRTLDKVNLDPGGKWLKLQNKMRPVKMLQILGQFTTTNFNTQDQELARRAVRLFCLNV